MSGKTNTFQGLSTLRVEERKKEPPKVNAALQEYLKKYADGGGDGGEKPRKKKRKADAGSGAIKIIDEDLQGQALRRKPPTSFEDLGEDDDCGCWVAWSGFCMEPACTAAWCMRSMRMLCVSLHSPIATPPHP